MQRGRSEVRRIVALSLSLGVGACGADASEREGVSRPAAAPTGLSPEPILVVGERANDPNHQFDRVVVPFLLPNGGIGVPLRSPGTIRIFDQQGEFERAVGSTGQGPGEFTDLTAAWAHGDTIEAFDSELNRVTRFVPGLAPETILLEGVASIQRGVPRLENGTWIFHGVKQVQRSGRDLIGVHRFGPGGAYLRELSEVSGFRRHLHDGGSGPDPISPRSLVRSAGDRVFVAETLTPRITVFEVSTGETFSFEWEPDRVLSHSEAVAMAQGGAASPGYRPMGADWTAASFRALTGDEQVPVFSDFLVDGEESVWVRDYEPAIHATHLGGLVTAGAGGEWMILDLQGRRVGSLAVPEDFEPLSIDSDHLIGVRRDELGVESVRVYRIERSGS